MNVLTSSNCEHIIWKVVTQFINFPLLRSKKLLIKRPVESIMGAVYFQKVSFLSYGQGAPGK
jgi:hypothetical protein